MDLNISASSLPALPPPPSSDRPRSITILGSTGSVGCNTIDIVLRSPECYRVVALTAQRKVGLLAEQAQRVKAELAVVADPACYRELREALAGTGIEAAAGPEALAEAGQRNADWVMSAIVGFAGLAPTLAAARRGAIIALANKEALVCSGQILLDVIGQSGGRLIPVDSEHSAIFQVFDADQRHAIERLILTASGGPFRQHSVAQMAACTPEQAVAHPNWSMGAKISVDSATMMNKGLEVIEARHLFGVTADQIEVVIHPQSVIHSMVGYADGSVLAQMGTPDMRTPIAYALGWPLRIASPAQRLDFGHLTPLTFESPDSERFPSLRLARGAMDTGGLMPAILNAANEVGVAAFLARRIGFLDIARVVEATMTANSLASAASGDLDLETLFAIDAQARSMADASCRKVSWAA